MSDLMKELMAEVDKVNRLETEVKRTVELQRNSVNAERKEKARDIAITLQEFSDALVRANAINSRHRGPFFVLPGVSYKEPDGYNRDVGIIFCADHIYVGKYYIGSGDCSPSESFGHAVKHVPCSPAMKTLIDAWNKEMEARVEEACVKHIKETTMRRMEALGHTLQKSNDEYAKYKK